MFVRFLRLVLTISVNHLGCIWMFMWKSPMTSILESSELLYSEPESKNSIVSFYGWGSTTSRLKPFRGGSLLFSTKFPRNSLNFLPPSSWYSFYRPRKDEWLSRPCSHPVVLNTRSVDWESSALTTRPFLHERLSLL